MVLNDRPICKDRHAAAVILARSTRLHQGRIHCRRLVFSPELSLAVMRRTILYRDQPVSPERINSRLHAYQSSPLEIRDQVRPLLGLRDMKVHLGIRHHHLPDRCKPLFQRRFVPGHSRVPPAQPSIRSPPRSRLSCRTRPPALVLPDLHPARGSQCSAFSHTTLPRTASPVSLAPASPSPPFPQR